MGPGDPLSVDRGQDPEGSAGEPTGRPAGRPVGRPAVPQRGHGQGFFPGPCTPLWGLLDGLRAGIWVWVTLLPQNFK